MSLKGQLGKALMRRVEAMPSVQAQRERDQRISPVRRAAIKAAYGAPDDETARLTLRMGSPSTAYFESPTKHHVASLMVGRPRRMRA